MHSKTPTGIANALLNDLLKKKNAYRNGRLSRPGSLLVENVCVLNSYPASVSAGPTTNFELVTSATALFKVYRTSGVSILERPRTLPSVSLSTLAVY